MSLGISKLVGGYGRTYVVVHESGTLEENSRVVRKSGLVDVFTVGGNMGTIVHPPMLVIDILSLPNPVPCIGRMLSVCTIACVSG